MTRPQVDRWTMPADGPMHEHRNGHFLWTTRSRTHLMAHPSGDTSAVSVRLHTVARGVNSLCPRPNAMADRLTYAPSE
jgi:hypothetical protein